MKTLKSPRRESPTLKKVNKKLSEYKLEEANKETGHMYKRAVWLVILLFLGISLIGWGYGSELVFNQEDLSTDSSNYKEYFQQVSLFVVSVLDLIIIYLIMKSLLKSRDVFFGTKFSGIALYGVKFLIVTLLVFMILVGYGQVLTMKPLWDNDASKPGSTSEKNLRRLAMIINFVLLIFSTLYCIHQV